MKMPAFNMNSSPLKGTNLIEAGAGTGKTYTLAGLYLRLVLEKGLSPEQILVMTFTEAATQELRHKIRSRLKEAANALEKGSPIEGLPDGLQSAMKYPVAALGTLKNTLQNFDQAAIFTIHGFCARVLYENTFESGGLFDTELVPDQEELRTEVIHDFWRTHLTTASPLFIRYILEKGLSPASFLSIMEKRSSDPHLRVIPEIEMPEITGREKSFCSALDRVKTAWHDSREEVKNILENDSGLNRTKYKKGKIPLWINIMDGFADQAYESPTLFEKFDKFTTSEINESLKNGHKPPSHPFFALCENLKREQSLLAELYDQTILFLKVSLFSYVREELSSRKKKRNIQSFDDLLLKILHALEQEGGSRLSEAIRWRFSAALVDEFQDTDPVQYAILKTVFSNKEIPFFLIGDPKQAIYGFRGADIFTYMKAAEEVESRYTLLKNWRSDPSLIGSINAVFSSPNPPFVYDAIPYIPATTADKKHPMLITGDRPEPSLQLCMVKSKEEEPPGRAVSKTHARSYIIRAVAEEASRLIRMGSQRQAMLGDRPLRESDIAVLVRTNREGRRMQEAFSVLRIPSVLSSSSDLFDSREAMDLETLLRAICQPDNDRRLKAAMATDIIGLSAEDISALEDNERALENRIIRFWNYKTLWEKTGFFNMFRNLLSEEKVMSRLIAFPDGERRITNLLHLADAFLKISSRRRLGLSGSIKWLSDRRNSPERRTEEHQLRLESDENAVNIVTIHKSKGLEYPIVFCPFSWGGSRYDNTTASFAFHDETADMKPTLDLGSDNLNQHRALSEKELLSENLRLLYVALTRARNRCYLFWGRIKGAETSAPAYLFHSHNSTAQGNPLESLENTFQTLTDEDMRRDLEKLASRAHGHLLVREITTSGADAHSALPVKPEPLQYRVFQGGTDLSWAISSFSSIISGKARGAEYADHDIPFTMGPSGSELEGAETPDEPDGLHAFPRGARAGIFFHDLLENLDFAGIEGPDLRDLTSSKLDRYAFDPFWCETVTHAIEGLLSTPLLGKSRGLTLAEIPCRDRLNELGFYFPIKKSRPDALRDLLEKATHTFIPERFPEKFRRLAFLPHRGYMKGFIDLVFKWKDRFYLLDWKSNFLGNGIEKYGQSSLSRAMGENFYFLQYYIYIIALDQYLRLRKRDYSYEKDFGGVFYIFIRGVDPEKGPDYGIFRDIPDPETIEALRDVLVDHQGSKD